MQPTYLRARGPGSHGASFFGRSDAFQPSWPADGAAESGHDADFARLANRRNQGSYRGRQVERGTYAGGTIAAGASTRPRALKFGRMESFAAAITGADPGDPDVANAITRPMRQGTRKRSRGRRQPSARGWLPRAPHGRSRPGGGTRTDFGRDRWPPQEGALAARRRRGLDATRC